MKIVIAGPPERSNNLKSDQTYSSYANKVYRVDRLPRGRPAMAIYQKTCRKSQTWQALFADDVKCYFMDNAYRLSMRFPAGKEFREQIPTLAKCARRPVYYYFRQWKDKGILGDIMQELVEIERIRQGREKAPSAVAIDSQSCKKSPFVSLETGVDGGKKINGHRGAEEKDTCWWIRWGCLWLFMYRRLILQMLKAAMNYSGKLNKGIVPA